jgi:hypothetical protein
MSAEGQIFYSDDVTFGFTSHARQRERERERETDIDNKHESVVKRGDVLKL